MTDTHNSAALDGGPAFQTWSRSSGDKKFGGTGIISRLFSRQVGGSKDSRPQETMPILNASPDKLASKEIAALIGPCPFIRPLEHKLVARRESSGLASPYHRSHCSGCVTCDVATPCSMSDVSSDNPGLSPALLSWITDDALKATLQGEYFDTDYEEKSEHVDKAAIRVQFIQQIRDIADSSAKNVYVLKHWKFYLISYSKGHFNMISPPEPPPRRTDFQYLPSFFPRDEVKRLIASHSFDIVWPCWTQEKAGMVVSAAMKRFGTKFVSLSFFDRDFELFKAENGYKGSKIERHISIAAHALLSADVLVILDTTKDWRFQRNPLVTTEPHIRFFAGAPMLASSGHVVGVLSVFDVVPRPAFDPFDRRTLSQYGALAMQDLEAQAAKLNDPDWCPTPLLDQSSSVSDESINWRLQSIGPIAPLSDIENSLVPPALRFHKDKTPPREHPRVFICDDFQHNANYQLSQTPPSLREYDNIKSGTKFGSHWKDRRNMPSVKYTTLVDPLSTLDSVAFRTPTPRPFSSSDITSLHIDPPNTPNRSIDGRREMQVPIDLTIEHFMSLSDDDCAERATSAVICEGKGKINAVSQDLSVPQKAPHASLQRIGPSVRNKRVNTMAEAAVSCALTAKTLGYDLIYVAEFKPVRSFMNDAELLAPSGLQPRVLCAHNLKETLKLDPGIHLEVLRMRGFKSWESHQEHYLPGEFQSGFMIAIHTEGGPLHRRSHGVVFGAYRKPRYDSSFPGTTSVAEMEKLAEAAEEVKNILFKRRRGAQRTNTEPTPATGFLAHEAYEVETPNSRLNRGHEAKLSSPKESLKGVVNHSPSESRQHYRPVNALGARTHAHQGTPQQRY